MSLIRNVPPHRFHGKIIPKKDTQLFKGIDFNSGEKRRLLHNIIRVEVITVSALMMNVAQADGFFYSDFSERSCPSFVKACNKRDLELETPRGTTGRKIQQRLKLKVIQMKAWKSKSSSFQRNSVYLGIWRGPMIKVNNNSNHNSNKHQPWLLRRLFLK